MLPSTRNKTLERSEPNYVFQHNTKYIKTLKISLSLVSPKDDYRIGVNQTDNCALLPG